MKKLSIIIPTLNEADNIVATLTPLQPLRQKGLELIVADGGSGDATTALAQPLADYIVQSERGRARQMNSGAASATGDVLLFLHADTRLPENFDQHINSALHNSHWGRFDVRLSGSQPLLRAVEFMMNRRSRLTGVCTGDQALFITRELFNTVGCFPAIPLMEDIAISKTLKQHGHPTCISARVITSSRRWEQHGILRTIVLMWRLRLAYFCGATPDTLAALYQKG